MLCFFKFKFFLANSVLRGESSMPSGMFARQIDNRAPAEATIMAAVVKNNNFLAASWRGKVGPVK